MSILSFPAEPNMSLNRRVSTSIRGLMGERGVSQTTVADALGMTQEAVSRRLVGKVPWRLPELEVVAILFDTTAVELLGGVLPQGPNGGGRPRQDSNLRPSDYKSGISRIVPIWERRKKRTAVPVTTPVVPQPRRPARRVIGEPVPATPFAA